MVIWIRVAAMEIEVEKFQDIFPRCSKQGGSQVVFLSKWKDGMPFSSRGGPFHLIERTLKAYAQTPIIFHHWPENLTSLNPSY